MPKLCDYQNCRKRACYGVKRDCPIRCIEHKECMKLASRICMCGKGTPSYNKQSETIGICCISCKTETMVDVKSKKCKCGKAQPHYNEPNEKTSICCSSCKTVTMINVRDRKCKCGKIPNFNEPTETAGICCASCKTTTMINLKKNLAILIYSLNLTLKIQ